MIKSEKAKVYLRRLAPELPIDAIELTVAKHAVSLAETEAEERHAAELQALTKEIARCKSIFESIRDASLKTTTGNVSHQKAHIIGMASRMVEFLTKNFAKNEKDDV